MENRLLTLDEVMALPEGAWVWIEDDPRDWLSLHDDGAAYVRLLLGRNALQRPEDKYPHVPDGPYDIYGEMYRAWLHKPTDAEKAAHPWPA